jgi:hypothetical protein
VAFPAIGLDIHRRVTLFTEFLAVFMAVHAGVAQAFFKFASVARDMNPVPVTHDIIPPFIEQLHMIRPHVGG